MLEMLFLKVVQATRGVVIEQLLSTHYALNTTVRYTLSWNIWESPRTDILGGLETQS